MTDISLKFPDGSVRDYKRGMTGAALAESISKSLAKKAVALMVDGELRDLADPIEADAEVRIITRTDPEALELQGVAQAERQGGVVLDEQYGLLCAFLRHGPSW